MARQEPYRQASRQEAPSAGRQPWRRSGPIIASLAVLIAFVIVLAAVPRGGDAHTGDLARAPAPSASLAPHGNGISGGGVIGTPSSDAVVANLPRAPASGATTGPIAVTAPQTTPAAPQTAPATNPPAPTVGPTATVGPIATTDISHAIPTATLPAVGDESPGQPAEPPPTSAEPEALNGYHWPLFHARITSFFQPRDTGFLIVDGQRIHQGLDITTFCGDHVTAAHAGTVVAAGRHFGDQIGFITPPDAFYAKYQKAGTMGQLPIVVVVDDGNGYRSMYVHLAQASVEVGDHVNAGDTVGLEGMTGNATGCHLHYELVRMDGPWMRVAPEQVHQNHYPMWQRARIDPLRVLSLKDPRAARLVPGINPPKVSPGLGRATAP